MVLALSSAFVMQVARAINIPLLLLCSTDDQKVRDMWLACGFEYTKDAHIRKWDVCQGDLIFMTNTVQMHKILPPPRRIRPVKIKHGSFQSRIYAATDTKKGAGLALMRAAEAAHSRKRLAKPVTNTVAKKVAKRPS
jgi:hypothetical protein